MLYVIAGLVVAFIAGFVVARLAAPKTIAGQAAQIVDKVGK